MLAEANPEFWSTVAAIGAGLMIASILAVRDYNHDRKLVEWLVVLGLVAPVQYRLIVPLVEVQERGEATAGDANLAVLAVGISLVGLTIVTGSGGPKI